MEMILYALITVMLNSMLLYILNVTNINRTIIFLHVVIVLAAEIYLPNILVNNGTFVDNNINQVVGFLVMIIYPLYYIPKLYNRGYI